LLSCAFIWKERFIKESYRDPQISTYYLDKRRDLEKIANKIRILIKGAI